MKREDVLLSKRLQMLADLVSSGNRVADVGCDHGYLPVWLVLEGVSPRALAMDVRKGPLEAAGRHIAEYGLGSYIELRLSDGLRNYEIGEADTLVCAGMGGRLMERILTESMDKAKTFGELILQPQSELREFRVFLRRAGFGIVQEAAVCEDGKYYFAMKAVRRASSGENEGKAEEERRQIQRVYDKFGEGLLSQKHPVLREYLQKQSEKLRGIAEALAGADSERRQTRLAEILEETDDVERALRLMEQSWNND